MAHKRTRYPLLVDEDLISLVAKGDTGAFGVLYDRHARISYGLAHRMMGGRQPTEDVVQDAFLRIWRKAKTHQPERGSVRTWILSIVHNRAVDELRFSASHNRTWEKASSSADKSQPCEAFAEASRNVLREQVCGILGTLPHEQREVLRLAFYAGHTHTEIADLMGLPLGTVKGRVRLGLKKLGERLRQGEIAGPP